MKKLSRTEGIQMIKNYLDKEIIKLDWFKNIEPFIKSIVFYGSTAKGLNRADSDLDVLIFVPLEIEKKYTKGEYSEMFEGREVNIVLRSIERLRELAKGEHNDFEAEVFRDCEIILEGYSEVGELIEKIIN